MACFTAIRVFVLLFAAVALALAVVGVLMPFFMVPSSRTNTVAALNTTVRSSSFSVANDMPTLRRFSLLAGAPPAKSTMTLWKLKYGTAVGNTSSVDLRDEYFSCYSGNMLIQSAEGIAVVTCVLAAANFLLSTFTFAFSAVVKFPLALYFFLSAATAAVTFGLMLNLYLHGWCDDTSLKAAEWDFALGFFFFVISCGVSLISSVLTMFVD